MDWVCRDAWKGPFSQSIFYAGGIVGTLGFGVMADHVGRYSLQIRIYTTFPPYKKDTLFPRCFRFPAFFYSSALVKHFI